MTTPCTTLSKPASLGTRMAWADAERYARGTRRDRREIRRRLAKGKESYTPFWRSYFEMFEARIQAFSEAIAEGRIARTANPHKLANLMGRI